jgi:restriction system protein
MEPAVNAIGFCPESHQMNLASKYPPPTLSPKQFELAVKSLLDNQGHELEGYESRHREVISGPDGNYEFDITIRFSAFGTSYLTLIECKHYKDSVEREKVQALWAKIQSVGAHKGILCATAGFQSGAIEFAISHGIALIEIADGRSAIIAKASVSGLMDHPFPPVGWLINENSCTLLDDQDSRRLSLLDLPLVV